MIGHLLVMIRGFSGIEWGFNAMWCPSSLAFSCFRTPITMVVVGNDISIVFIGFINQCITFGGHHLVKTKKQDRNRYTNKAR